MRRMKVNAMTAALIAGVLSGGAGLLAFLVIHHFWIRPILILLTGIIGPQNQHPARPRA